MKLTSYRRLITALSAISGSIVLIACLGDKVPPAPMVADVSLPSSRDAWVVTRDMRLLHLRIRDGNEEATQFRGKARLVSFVSALTGWVLDRDGRVWFTDNGKDWRERGQLTSDRAILHASNLVFADRNVGWLTTSFGLWLTEDGGANWSELALYNTAEQPVGFYPTDPDSGWLLLTNGNVHQTTDRGKSWSVSLLGVSTTVRAFYSNGRESTWAGGSDGSGGLYRMDMIGEWEQVLDPAQRRGAGIQSISFSLPRNGWIAGLRFSQPNADTPPRGLVMRSRDGGATWSTLENSPREEMFTHIRFFDENEGWLVGENGVYHSEDGGTSWNEISAF